MCLENAPNEVKEILKSGRKVFTCYKVLLKEGTTLFSPYVCTFVWSPGIVKSSARKATPPVMARRYLTSGIHVFRTKKAAEEERRYWTHSPLFIGWGKVVALTCKIEDLIGANFAQMLFRKVTLSKAEYERQFTKKKVAAKKTNKQKAG